MNIVIKRRFGEYVVMFNGIVVVIGTLAKCQEFVRSIA